MARQSMRFTVRGVGAGRVSARAPSVRPRAPRLVSAGNGRVRAYNGRSKV